MLSPTSNLQPSYASISAHALLICRDSRTPLFFQNAGRSFAFPNLNPQKSPLRNATRIQCPVLCIEKTPKLLGIKNLEWFAQQGENYLWPRRNPTENHPPATEQA